TFTIRLPAKTEQAANQPGVLLREQLVYDLSPRGLDLAATWKLDVRATSLSELELLLDPGLNLVSAQLGDADVPFSTTPGPDHATGVRLSPPEALAGSDRSLRLAAIASPSGEATWTLPRIRAPKAQWQEGTCTLLVREPLVVGRLTTRDCRQAKYSVLPEPN